MPAWSEPFIDDARAKLVRAAALRQIDREWAWGGATGAGVKVAIIDSGVEGRPSRGAWQAGRVGDRGDRR